MASSRASAISNPKRRKWVPKCVMHAKSQLLSSLWKRSYCKKYRNFWANGSFPVSGLNPIKYTSTDRKVTSWLLPYWESVAGRSSWQLGRILSRRTPFRGEYYLLWWISCRHCLQDILGCPEDHTSSRFVLDYPSSCQKHHGQDTGAGRRAPGKKAFCWHDESQWL